MPPSPPIATRLLGYINDPLVVKPFQTLRYLRMIGGCVSHLGRVFGIDTLSPEMVQGFGESVADLFLYGISGRDRGGS